MSEQRSPVRDAFLKYLLLLRLQFMTRFASLTPSAIRDAWKDKGRKKTVQTVAIVFLIVYVACFVVFLEWKLTDALIMLGQPSLLISLSVMASMLFTLLYGIFYLMSSLYFNKNTALLAALPIRDRQLYAARFTSVWFGEAGLAAVFILPAVVIYSIRVTFSAALCVRAFFVLLLCPVLPLVLDAVLASLLARASAFRRYREAITTVGSMLLILVMVGLSMTFSSVSTNAAMDEEYLAGQLSGSLGMLGSLTDRFPPAGWAVRGILSGWGDLALFALVSLAAHCVILLVCSRHYIAVASLQGESASARGKVDLASVRYASAGPLGSLFRHEMRLLLRTPAYLLNCVLSCVLMPIIMIVAMAVGFSSSGEISAADALNEIFGSMGGSMTGLAAAVLTALLSFMAGMNAAASTAVSREGKTHALYRMLPVSPRQVVWAKTLSGFAFAFAGILAAGILLLVFLPFLWGAVLLGVLWSSLLSLCFCCFGVLIDAARPKLAWSTEQEAVKQNYNMLLAMLLGFGILLALALLTVLFFHVLESDTLYIVLMTLVLVLVCGGSALLLNRCGDKTYPGIE